MSLQGILSVYKPAGISSYDVIRRIKKVLNSEFPKTKFPKIGHAGTLDPFAEGVLLVLFGKATKAAEKLMAMEKAYEGVILFGHETDTGDITGKLQAQKEVSGLGETQIKEATAGFTGKIKQAPPMYSALKHKGERLYHMARRGVTLELPPREVEIKEFQIISYESPRARFSCRVGRGAYIRSLAVDLGRSLGVGACLETLCRSAVGRFRSSEALPLEALKQVSDIEKNLFPEESL